MEVVICTYNRAEKVKELTLNLIDCQPAPNRIIVVDSSDTENEELKNLSKVFYIHSTHKNQPYQRYLGYQVAQGDVILFLDDDMEVIDTDFLSKIGNLLVTENAVGLALHFKDKHQDTSLSVVPRSTFFKQSNLLKRFKNWFTGYTDLPQGTLGLCGNRGKQASYLSSTQYVSGGAFVAKRSALFQNFNFQLFDLFEQRIGMGEDALIGYGIHKQGKLLFVPEIFFLHNDQKDSTYSMNVYDYSRRVMFSRLYLSLEKTRLDRNQFMFAKLHFHWYSFWRLIGLAINQIVKSSINRKAMFSGAISGWYLTLDFQFCSSLQRNQFWLNEIKKNLQK
jgi:glycosyltransferase involved in cell wall biosynthesis